MATNHLAFLCFSAWTGDAQSWSIALSTEQHGFGCLLFGDWESTVHGPEPESLFNESPT